VSCLRPNSKHSCDPGRLNKALQTDEPPEALSAIAEEIGEDFVEELDI